MKFAEYQKLLDLIPYGKRLPGALYVLREGGSDFGAELNRLLEQLAALHQISAEFNLLKF